MLIKNKGLNL